MKKLIQTCKTNIKNGFKTTIFGIFLFASGIGLIIDQRETLTTLTATVFGVMCVTGIGLIFAPDTVLDALKKAINKFLK